MKNEGYFSLYLRANGYWYYATYNKFGRRVFKSTGEKRKTYALRVATDRAKAGTLLSGGIIKQPKFADFAKDFWNYDTCPVVQDVIQRGGSYSRRTAIKYQSTLDNFLIPYFGAKYLGEITKNMISVWLRDLPEKANLAPKTVNEKLLCLRHILQAAVDQGIIDSNPAKEVKPLHKQIHRKSCFTVEQIRSLFATPWEEVLPYIACYLSAMTGMRLGEVRALQSSQIHDGYIVVDAGYNDKDGRKTTKSGWGRIVPIAPGLQSLLATIKPTNGWMFTTTGTVPVSEHFFTKPLYRHMEACGISKEEKLTFHSFRHFFNTRLVASGLQGEVVRAVIGHESDSMTEHYLHLSAEDLSRITEIQQKIM